MEEERIFKFKINRILANNIDALVVFVLFWAAFIFPFLNFLTDSLAGGFNTSYLLFMIVAGIGGLGLGFLYLFISPVLLSGATCGLKINNLRFENVDKTRIRKSQLLIRSFLLVFAMVLSCGLSLIAEIISIACSEQGKDFFDFFTGVKVVAYELQ